MSGGISCYGRNQLHPSGLRKFGVWVLGTDRPPPRAGNACGVALALCTLTNDVSGVPCRRCSRDHHERCVLHATPCLSPGRESTTARMATGARQQLRGAGRPWHEWRNFAELIGASRLRLFRVLFSLNPQVACHSTIRSLGGNLAGQAIAVTRADSFRREGHCHLALTRIHAQAQCTERRRPSQGNPAALVDQSSANHALFAARGLGVYQYRLKAVRKCYTMTKSTSRTAAECWTTRGSRWPKLFASQPGQCCHAARALPMWN